MMYLEDEIWLTRTEQRLSFYFRLEWLASIHISLPSLTADCCPCCRLLEVILLDWNHETWQNGANSATFLTVKFVQPSSSNWRGGTSEWSIKVPTFWSGADKYPLLLQGPLTREWNAFPAEDKSQMLVAFLSSAKGVLVCFHFLFSRAESSVICFHRTISHLTFTNDTHWIFFHLSQMWKKLFFARCQDCI